MIVPDLAVSCRDRGDAHPAVWQTPQLSRRSGIQQSPPALATSVPTRYGAPVHGGESTDTDISDEPVVY